MRLLQSHRPRYDKAQLRAVSAACYVHLDDRARRPPSLVRRPRATGAHVGPLPTTQMGRLVLDALSSRTPRLRAHQALAGAWARQDAMDAARRCGRMSITRESGSLEIDHGLLAGLPVLASGPVDWAADGAPLRVGRRRKCSASAAASVSAPVSARSRHTMFTERGRRKGLHADRLGACASGSVVSSSSTCPFPRTRSCSSSLTPTSGTGSTGRSSGQIPSSPSSVYADAFGNLCRRLTLPAGRVSS